MFSFFVSKFATRILWGIYMPPEALGLLALYIVTQDQTRSLATGWLQNAAIRFLPDDQAYLSRFLSFAIAVIVLTSLVGLSVAILLKITVFHANESFKWFYLLLTVVVFIESSLFVVFQSFLRGIFEHMRFSAAAIIQDVARLVFLILLLPHVQDSVAAVLNALIISYLPAVYWQAGKLRSTISVAEIKQRSFSKDSLLIRSIKYGVPLSVSLFFLNLSLMGDRYLLAKLFSLKQLGIYAFWMGIGLQVVQGMNRLFFMAVNPRLFQVNSMNSAKAIHYVRIFSGYYVLLGLPAIILLGNLLQPVLILLKIKSEYATGAHLIYFGMGMAFFLALGQLVGKKREFSIQMTVFIYAAIAALLVMVIGILILSQLVGLYGAAIAVLLGSASYFVVIAMIARNWPPFSHAFIGCLAGFGMLLVSQWMEQHVHAITVFMAGLVLFVFYVLLLWRFKIIRGATNIS